MYRAWVLNSGNFGWRYKAEIDEIEWMVRWMCGVTLRNKKSSEESCVNCKIVDMAKFAGNIWPVRARLLIFDKNIKFGFLSQHDLLQMIFNLINIKKFVRIESISS